MEGGVGAAEEGRAVGNDRGGKKHRDPPQRAGGRSVGVLRPVEHGVRPVESRGVRRRKELGPGSRGGQLSPAAPLHCEEGGGGKTAKRRAGPVGGGKPRDGGEFFRGGLLFRP